MWANDPITWFSLFLWMVSTAAGEEDAQHTLIVDSQTIDAAPAPGAHDVYDYGVGLDLTGSYGTVSVSYSNGTKMNLAKIDGSESYKALFKKYSQEASQHLHPPYTNWYDQQEDLPRVREREWNKAHGFPANEDVGVISTMISGLVAAAEQRLGLNITAALAATPNLVALYKEDMADAFEYSAIELLDYWWDFEHTYHETGAAVAGNGFGLCQDFKDQKLCHDEENNLPFETVLSVMYTADCLCVELASIKSASYMRGHPRSPPTMDFTLGLSALHDNPSEKYYWEAVRDTIMRGMVLGWRDTYPEKVFVLGDQSHNENFRALLNEALLKYNEKLPPIFDEDPVFRAAQGAAEMARRRRFVD